MNVARQPRDNSAAVGPTFARYSLHSFLAFCRTHLCRLVASAQCSSSASLLLSFRYKFSTISRHASLSSFEHVASLLRSFFFFGHVSMVMVWLDASFTCTPKNQSCISFVLIESNLHVKA